jgi:2,4-dienoyl-CoA reductase-like NADH-dependent reductase (Old Yellow Enzyme family)
LQLVDIGSGEKPSVGKDDGGALDVLAMHPSLEPFTFPRNGQTVRNRTVLAAMTNKHSHEDGKVSLDEIQWLEARARGGFGIITSAASHVQANGQGWEGEFGVWSDDHIPGLTRMADAIKGHGSMAWVQLFHGGMRAPESLTGRQPMSASENHISESLGMSRAMTNDEILETIEAFGNAAQRCEEAGFDGVELHGAHGYLISQFLGPSTNRRTDAWGGTSKKRALFLKSILEKVRQKTKPSFLVGVRLSPLLKSGGITIEDALETLDHCQEMELDFIHVSCWDIQETASTAGQMKTLTKWFSDSLKGSMPLITTGGVWNAQDACEAFDQGAELVGVGRVAIGHPDWPRYLHEGAPQPKRAPFSAQELREASLNDTFVEYMRRWDGFVKD